MLNLMSVAKIKKLLGITGTEFDSVLAEFLPIVSADVRRYLNEPMSDEFKCTLKAGSDVMVTAKELQLGQVIFSDALPDDTYVTRLTQTGAKLSAKATVDGTSFVPTVLISQWQAIARMVFYRAGNAKPVQPGGKVQSKTMGPVSVSYSVDIDNQWNYPRELLDDLGKPRLRTC